MAANIWPSEWEGSTISALDGSWQFWHSIPFQYLFIGHALFCTIAGSEFKDRWLVHLLLTFLWGNGGGILTAALMMHPERATFAFFQGDFITGTWVVCWWLVNYCPGGLPAKLLSKWYIKMLAKSCTMLLRAQLIISRVDLAVQLYPHVVSAPLILGTIAGCGGRLFADGIMTGWQSMPGLAEVTSPGFVSRSAAFAAVAYYALAYWTQLLPVHAAAGLVETALMLHALTSDLTGLPLDFTAPITHLMHTLTFVPAPPGQPQPAPVSVTVKRVTPKPAVTSSPAKTPTKPPAKTPAKSPAKSTPASKQGTPIAAAVADAVASPLPNGTAARKRRGKAAADEGMQQEAADGVCVSPQQEQTQGAQGQKGRRSVAPEAASNGTAGGVTTRRRAAAAAYA